MYFATKTRRHQISPNQFIAFSIAQFVKINVIYEMNIPGFSYGWPLENKI